MLIFSSKSLGMVKVTLFNYHEVLSRLSPDERLRLQKAVKSFWHIS